MTALLAHDQLVARTVINRIAGARGLAAPWPGADAELPSWLTDADFSQWGIVELGELRQRLLAPRRRARDGVIYTPPEVVDFQVPAALQAANLNRLAGHPRPLAHITIHDPFCGPGIFLIHTARHLTEWCITQADPPPHVPDFLIQAVTAQVMSECLYGTDLDAVAIDLAKSVCWLEIGGIRPITFMDDNIVLGDTFRNQLPAKLLARWPL
ncbi:hypothetical protein DQ384_26145 [Sphaerisporangium album]|uniref:site-specific DNA-methyltransferase (adenine-specific) n=1 Tax=Sphaerisporangium album TaxID=509200 RepID=A0A367FA01_9ACTN|nr:N-6 DNA methylase [Sphaerisporangium album]RCG27203.1 hypothetical protein DQ384_26145 [Sphaerisporangium album]